jgi:DoxX-like family
MSITSIQSARPARRVGAWTLQGILAAAFLAAGSAKLAGVPFMVDLFAQIGLGQWFRVTTGAVEVAGAVTLLEHFPMQAKGREIVTQQGLIIAVASDVAMSEEIVRRLNKSDWSDQEDQWAL